MGIAVTCACGNRFEPPDRQAGKLVECPSCGEFVAVPEPDSSEPFAAEDLGETRVATPDGTPTADDDSFELADPAPEPSAAGEPPAPTCAGPPEDDELLGVVESDEDATGAGPCPNCRTLMAEGAVLCTQCGWNRVLERFVSHGTEIRYEERLGAGGVVAGLWLGLKGLVYRLRLWLAGGAALALVAAVVVAWVVHESQKMRQSQGSAVGEMVGEMRSEAQRKQRQIRRDHVDPEEARGMYLDAQSAHLRGDTAGAIRILKQLMQFYPGTEHAAKAPDLLRAYQRELAAASTRPTLVSGMPEVTDPLVLETVDLVREGRAAEAIQELEDIVGFSQMGPTRRQARTLLDYLRTAASQPSPVTAPATTMD